MTWTFQQRVEFYCKSPHQRIDNNTKYHSPMDSYNLFKRWARRQDWDIAQLITDTINVMNKTLQKINTIALIGKPNSGKTKMFADPLAAIMKHVGRLGNRGSDSPFIWENCVNCSMILMNECVMNPALRRFEERYGRSNEFRTSER